MTNISIFRYKCFLLGVVMTSISIVRYKCSPERSEEEEGIVTVKTPPG
jgi:hypothetical protein